MKKRVAIIGAGPAGLSASYQLTRYGFSVTVLESHETLVGGLSRTVNYKGFLFDIGGHRFFTKSKFIEEFWHYILGDSFKKCKRKSRIFYKGHFFDYPLKIINALSHLGTWETLRCLVSYVVAKVTPKKEIRNFEDWVVEQFGRRLFEVFFKSYTEKVWGRDCQEISADWASQRIKQLSLGKAIQNALGMNRPSSKEKVIRTLSDTFHYPTQGPGMLWSKVAEQVSSQGGEIKMGHQVEKVKFHLESGEWEVIAQTPVGTKSVRCDFLISSAPLKELIHSFDPEMPIEVREAANALRYRDFIVVCFILEDSKLFDDQWIYIHDPKVRVGRIQNFKSWSSEMVPNPNYTAVGLEYFCFENDSLWNLSDEKLIELAKNEFSYLGFSQPNLIIDAHVIKQKKAYPVYDMVYRNHLAMIRSHLETHYPTLHLVGRNGMHRYNNQDHAILTGMLAAENIVMGRKNFDIWNLDQDVQYQEVVTENEPAERQFSLPTQIENN